MLHVHVDASGSQRFLEEDAGVGAAREGTLRDLQLEARAAGLLPQELRLSGSYMCGGLFWTKYVLDGGMNRAGFAGGSKP